MELRRDQRIASLRREAHARGFVYAVTDRWEQDKLLVAQRLPLIALYLRANHERAVLLGSRRAYEVR